MEFMDKIIALLDGALMQAGVIAIVVEFVLRLVKTEKPKSIIWMIAGLVKGAALVLAKVAELLDKILPQNVKPQA